jgi:hypothetical protein
MAVLPSLTGQTLGCPYINSQASDNCCAVAKASLVFPYALSQTVIQEAVIILINRFFEQFQAYTITEFTYIPLLQILLLLNPV